MHQRRAVRSHLAEASVVRSEPPRDGVLLQNGRDRSPQRVAGQVLHPAVGSLQRREGLLISLAVSYEMERNQRVVQDVPQRVRARDVQRVAVLDDRLLVVVGLSQAPFVGDTVAAGALVFPATIRASSEFESLVGSMILAPLPVPTRSSPSPITLSP